MRLESWSIGIWHFLEAIFQRAGSFQDILVSRSRPSLARDLDTSHSQRLRKIRFTLPVNIRTCPSEFDTPDHVWSE